MPIHGINYSTFICLFESEKCRKEGKKLQIFEYLKNEKSFLDEIKSFFFIVFKGLSCHETNWKKWAQALTIFMKKSKHYEL